ncbi:cilia- and flagella-associated protein 91-like [Drosophila serrata]|uniref:cilia- and flagella-associated protein 91-like n=1 Tax=Drosophila serrata TaxID=7274 RepID=UPI000A1D163C|nr:cilia- and flagella-associated protein 91-like [Drosophila serrata]
MRITGGANNPNIRNVGNLPRTDSECHFKAPGLTFLKTQQLEHSTHEIRLNPVKPIRKELKNKCDFFPKYVDNRPFKDQTTQTLYRESSAQTLAYLPEIGNKENADTLELFSLAKLIPGEKPPGLHEVEILERARKRWLFQDAIKTTSKRLISEAKSIAIKPKFQNLLEAFEWEQWIEREEYIQECQMIRLQIVIKMFDKREKEMHAASRIRIEQACEGIEKRRQVALRKNESEFQREMRRLYIKMANIPRKWKKPSPMQDLGSPCSEFYGPLIRHGVDPARRSYQSVTERKAFDMRIDDLEKRVNMKKVQCPFSKLREWSKPKEYVREYEQNFCNDRNLQRLYESLKHLRTQSDVKIYPKCLKKRLKRSEGRRSSSISLMFDSRKYARYSQTRISHPIEEARVQPKKPKQADPVILKSTSRGQQDLEHLIYTYEGTYIGNIMQFLSDEMGRLKTQRKLHFFTILAHRERLRREASEAGMRQTENDMRILYEEIFQRSHSGVQDVSQQYIDTIMERDVDDIMGESAAKTVNEMAQQIDKDINRWLDSFKMVQNPLTYVPLRQMLKGMVCPDVEAVIKRGENVLITQYIVEDVIFGRVWEILEPFDVVSTLTSDFIDRLIDNDLFLFSSDSESETPHKRSWYEAEAIIRKLIRQAVPGQRWMEETERVVAETYNDLFDDIFDEIMDKAENPPMVLPSDLIVVCPSVAMFKVCQHKPKMRRTVSHESMQRAKFLRGQVLSLVKKFKDDNVTGVLATDELMNFDSDNSVKKEKFVGRHSFQKKKIKPSTAKPKIDVSPVTSIEDICDAGYELNSPGVIHSTTSSQQIEPDSDLDMDVQSLEAVSVASPHPNSPVSKAPVPNIVGEKTEQKVSEATKNKEPEAAKEPEEPEDEIEDYQIGQPIQYAKHHSTIFSFR